jgi:hypothetical protein
MQRHFFVRAVGHARLTEQRSVFQSIRENKLKFPGKNHHRQLRTSERHLDALRAQIANLPGQMSGKTMLRHPVKCAPPMKHICVIVKSQLRCKWKQNRISKMNRCRVARESIIGTMYHLVATHIIAKQQAPTRWRKCRPMPIGFDHVCFRRTSHAACLDTFPDSATCNLSTRY